MSIQQAAIGVDIGSFKAVITAAKKGGVDVVCNQANFRQTPVIVGFSPEQRNIGEPGYTKYKSNFRDTVIFPTRFLGLKPDCPFLAQEMKFLTCQIDCNKQIGFHVNCRGEKLVLNSQQLTAAFLTKIKEILQVNKVNNNQAVFSVPDYYTQVERKAFYEAAAIAGISVPKLCNQSTALGISYGLFRKKDLTATPRNVVIIDFGHSKLSLSAHAFTQQKMTLLHLHSERNLGARDMDYVLFNHYRNILLKKGLDFTESKKAVMRCLDAVQKQRKMLSANSQATINIQYFFEDNDLNYLMKRQEFQSMVIPVVERIKMACAKFKADMLAKKHQIHSVQIVGGASRIPAFQAAVAQVFGGTICKTLNSSESISRGVCMAAAYISPLFKVAAYTVQNKNTHSIWIAWNFVQAGAALQGNHTAYPHKSELFPVDGAIPSFKSLKFKRTQPIQLILYYNDPIAHCPPCIAYIRTVPAKPSKPQFSVVVKFRLCQDGMVRLQQNYLNQQWQEQQKVPKKKQEKKQQKKQDDKKDDKMQTEEFQIKKVSKSQAVAIKLEVNYFIQKNSSKQVQTFFELQAKLNNQDRLIKDTYQKKNQLQSLVYNTKQKLGDIYKPYARAQQIPHYISILNDNEAWLEDDGFKSSRGQYLQRIQKIRAFEAPITQRYFQAQQQKQVMPVSVKQLVQIRNLVQSKDPKHDHITIQQRNSVRQMCQQYQQWLGNVIEKQSTTPLFDKPTFLYKQAMNKLQSIKNLYQQWLKLSPSKSQPKSPPKSPPINLQKNPPKKQTLPKKRQRTRKIKCRFSEYKIL